jgi:cyclopropane-fatty-acyl-phospholipid synthase
MSIFSHMANQLAESGYVPDSVIRQGIRRLVRQRRESIFPLSATGEAEVKAFARMMSDSPVALVPELANEQHYEVPAEFFSRVLGEYRKYSCCYWEDGVQELDEAERAALQITCDRAQIVDGIQILELGCGWGSLSLYLAQNFPGASVTSVSNSASQREYIEAQARALGLTNLRIITADMNHFDIDGTFDRVVSVEMFEHMRNYRVLFQRISRWLSPDGRFFMHIFCHKSSPYEFIDAGPSDWMSRHFFSGGIMPSENLPLQFQEHLAIDRQWTWNGTHYQQTAEAWLQNMDRQASQIRPLFDAVYGTGHSKQWFMRWRIFFLAVSEMFGSHGGAEWYVGHYLFKPKPR